MSTGSKRARAEEEEEREDIAADIQVEDVAEAAGTLPEWYHLASHQIKLAKDRPAPEDPLFFQLVLAAKDVRFKDRDDDTMRKIRKDLPTWVTDNLSTCEGSYLCIRDTLTKKQASAVRDALTVLKPNGTVGLWNVLRAEATPTATPFTLSITGLPKPTILALENIDAATDPLFLTFCDFTWQYDQIIKKSMLSTTTSERTSDSFIWSRLFDIFFRHFSDAEPGLDVHYGEVGSKASKARKEEEGSTGRGQLCDWIMTATVAGVEDRGLELGSGESLGSTPSDTKDGKSKVVRTLTVSRDQLAAILRMVKSRLPEKLAKDILPQLATVSVAIGQNAFSIYSVGYTERNIFVVRKVKDVALDKGVMNPVAAHSAVKAFWEARFIMERTRKVLAAIMELRERDIVSSPPKGP